MSIADRIARGEDPAAAAAAARREFGNLGRVQEVTREMWGWSQLDRLGQDLRYAVRGLLRRPGFTLAAGVSLGLGLGTLTVIYSLVDALLLRPLPVARPEELVVLGSRTGGVHGVTTDGVSYRNFLALERRHDLFRSLAGCAFPAVTLHLTPGAPGRVVLVVAATGSYFPMLGVRPAIGRLLDSTDEARREPVIVLTDRLWRQRFGANPAVIGQSVRLSGVDVTIVGVTPPGFDGTHLILRPEGFVPRSLLPLLEPGQNNPAVRQELDGSLMIVGRMAAGMTIDRLRAALDVAAGDFARQSPDDAGLQLLASREIRARPSIAVAGAVPLLAAVFLGLAALVLVVACGNVAGLVLVRATTRRSELALRQALGASRLRLVRQLLTETVVLSGLGLVFGWIFVRAAVAGLGHLRIATETPIQLGVVADWRVLAFATAVAVAAGILVGILPAASVSRDQLGSSVKEGARSSGGGGQQRSLLVAAQLTVSTVALVAAGLFVRSLQQATRVELGFRPERLVTVGIVPHLAGYGDHQGRLVMDRIFTRIRALPAVARAAWSSVLPLQSMGLNIVDVFVDGPIDARNRRDRLSLLSNEISSDYFDVTGIRLLQGRAFTDRDDSLARKVAIVNDAAARVFWPGRSPIGQVLRTTRDGPPIEIVGVAATGKYLYVNEAPRPVLYLPVAQGLPGGRKLLVQSAGPPPALLVPQIRAAIEAEAPDIVPMELMTVEQYLSGSATIVSLRLAAFIAGAIGLLTLVQAVLGLYGVIAYSVAQRGREMGIRLALGAAPASIVRLVVFEGGRLVVIGLTLGALAAIAVGQAIRGLLVGVGAVDLAAFVTALAVLLAAGFGATYLPARRAARVDAIRALRAD
jgi:predicted permease